MAGNLDQILKIDVPVVVRLAEKQIPLGEVLRLVPGAIVELPKSADAELSLLVNNREIGCGTAVKVGENFGLRLSFIGDLKSRVRALGPAEDGMSSDEAEKLAEAMLAGQL